MYPASVASGKGVQSGQTKTPARSAFSEIDVAETKIIRFRLEGAHALDEGFEKPPESN